jgi:hypothetical protein
VRSTDIGAEPGKRLGNSAPAEEGRARRKMSAGKMK